MSRLFCTVLIGVLLTAVTLVQGGPPAPTPTTVLVSTQQGNVTGAVLDSVAYFLGIPFTLPPVGPLRWKTPSSSLPPWDGNATTYRPICLQPTATGLIGDEDCLYVNVYTPYPLPSTPLPVYVYIHGGGFIAGAGLDDPGDAFVRTSGGNMIFVSVSYRLGPWGFLALPSLSNERGVGNVATSGNFGIEDQRQALKWVQANIASYGGNPNNVTIGGESAGSISVCLHVVSALSAGLFQRAILESGGCDESDLELAASEQLGIQFTQTLAALGKSNCSSADVTTQLTCLRTITNTDIFYATAGFGGFNYFLSTALVPNIDGYNFVDFPSNVLLNGTMNKVDLLLGSNAAEMGLFIAPVNQNSQFPPATNNSINALATKYSGGNLAVMNFYNNATTSGAFPSEYLAYQSMLSKFLFQCPTLRLGQALAKAGKSVHSYMFNYTSVYGTYVAITHGALHSLELSYVFNTAGEIQDPTPDGVAPSTQAAWNQTADQAMSESMRNYWIKFIQTGDVNSAGTPPGLPSNVQAPTWPLFNAGTTDSLVFQYDGTIFSTTNLYKTECDLWGSLIQPRAPLVPRIVQPPVVPSSSSTGSSDTNSSSSSSTGGLSSATHTHSLVGTWSLMLLVVMSAILSQLF